MYEVAKFENTTRMILRKIGYMSRFSWLLDVNQKLIKTKYTSGNRKIGKKEYAWFSTCVELVQNHLKHRVFYLGENISYFFTKI